MVFEHQPGAPPPATRVLPLRGELAVPHCGTEDNMKLDLNDPKWTAYAFGELDESERAAVEAELRNDPAARQFVDELRTTGELLKCALATEPAARLTNEQRATLAADQPTTVNSPAVAPQSTVRRVSPRRRWVAVLGAVAASGLIAVVLLPPMRPSLQSARRADKVKTMVSEDRAPSQLQGMSEEAESTVASQPSDPYTVAIGGGLPGVKRPSTSSRLISELSTSNASAGRWAPGTLPQGNLDPTASSASSASSRPASQRNGPVSFADQESQVQQFTADGKPRGRLQKQLQFRQQSLNATLPVPLDYTDTSRQEGEVRKLDLLADDRSNETYDLPPENAFEPVAANPLSTFSIDVDTASYANVRRFLMQNNQLPPPAAVRIEEMLNYFRYDYPQPEGDVPFSVTTEVAACPWNADHRLVRVGLKGKEIAKENRPVSNLVFLLDVSGSMQDPNKLPLVRESMKMLVRELSENDRVAIVVYAGASGQVLDSTTGDQKDLITAAIDSLQAGGSTNGAGGIQQAYDVAMQHFIKGGTNRVILATDGDFNVGITDRSQLVSLIEDKAKSGVFLTTVGFGMGNLKDATLEQLADKGNGNYAYVDTLAEAHKVFVEEMAGTLVTIAKDVKVQIEFNPAEVASYRLIGYENRRLAAEDFNDDKKDAGEIGAGHTVTALYEMIPVAKARDEAKPGLPAGAAGNAGVDPLRYQKPAEAKIELTNEANNGELFTLKLRYKQPDGDTSKLIEHPVKDSGKAYREASGDFKFAASVAGFGMALRHSQHRGTITLDGIKELALEGRSFDPSGYRSEFLTLIDKAQALGAK